MVHNTGICVISIIFSLLFTTFSLFIIKENNVLYLLSNAEGFIRVKPFRMLLNYTFFILCGYFLLYNNKTKQKKHQMRMFDVLSQ